MKKITFDEVFIIMLLTDLPMFSFGIAVGTDLWNVETLLICYWLALVFQFIVFFTLFLSRKFF